MDIRDGSLVAGILAGWIPETASDFDILHSVKKDLNIDTRIRKSLQHYGAAQEGAGFFWNPPSPIHACHQLEGQGVKYVNL